MQQGTTRIEDFGEHIPGARKDAYTQDLWSAFKADPGFSRGLSGCWPAPDWKELEAEHRAEGIGREVLATVRALRDALRHPETRKREQWLCRKEGRPAGLRVIAVQLLDAVITAEEAVADAKALKILGHSIADAAAMYETLGHERDLRDYRLEHWDRRDTWEVIKHPEYLRVVRMAPDRHAAIAELGKHLERDAREDADTTAVNGKKTPKHPYKLYVRRTSGQASEYGIYRRHRGRLTLVRECADKWEGMKLIREQRDELDAWWTRFLEVPSERERRNRPRTPPGDAGTDDPAIFSDRFGFRGVQFGNWVRRSERHADLMDASQGLEDLALALGWPSGLLSLGGRLGLAFGARGHGGRAGVKAHYEPGQSVIAISRPAGAGSLAHEWFHALDNLAGRLATGSMAAYATDPLAHSRSTQPSRLTTALRNYGSALRQSGYAKRSAQLDERRRKAYWGTVIELAARAFEGWVRAALAEHGIVNDYLVNIKAPEKWPSDPTARRGYPYPLADELLAFRPLVREIGLAALLELRRQGALDQEGRQNGDG